MDLQARIAKVREEMASEGKATPKLEIARYIDHTILKQEASEAQVQKLCVEAREYGFASVCVNSAYAAFVVEQLRGSGVLPCVTVGFPLGAASTEGKAAETQAAVMLGVREVDMVIHVGAVKNGDWDYVRRDIAAVVSATKGMAKVKVIIETCLLNDEEKIRACIASQEAGADFVKTSTGFSTGGARVEDVRLMRAVVGNAMGVKASGGIRDYAAAKAMLEAGANRLGTSAGIAIVDGSK